MVHQLVTGPTSKSTIPAPMFISWAMKACTRGMLAVEQIYISKPKIRLNK